jgi:hypothetical protein
MSELRLSKCVKEYKGGQTVYALIKSLARELDARKVEIEIKEEQLSAMKKQNTMLKETTKSTEISSAINKLTQLGYKVKLEFTS